MMCVKVDNFMKEAKVNWNLVGIGSICQFKSFTGATNKKINIEVEVQDVMVDAHIIYSQDTSKNFEVEHVCLLLKDQPKFDAEFMSKC